ncbi:MAG: hypothetical protein O2894_13195, partial [Planctomycetota bacterium]|nr:hypothetical protein [Planctomycetota bacterium]
MARTYDDETWHRARLPGDLPRKAAATHLGMFVAWCAARGLLSPWHGAFDPDRPGRLTRREFSGRDYLLDHMGGKLEDEHLTAAGQVFASQYVASGRYLGEYQKALAADLPSVYHVEDTWSAFDRLAP